MSRPLLACLALLSTVAATPVLAVPMTMPCAPLLDSQLAQARMALHDRLDGRPDRAARLHAALARLAQLHDRAMSSRRIQGGVLSAGQRERLSHSIAEAAAAS